MPVYLADGRANLAHLKGKKGVYHIFEDGRRVYVGHSRSNLYKTILRHFQKWDDDQYRTTYFGKARKRYTVKVWLCQPADCLPLEESHILRYRPRDNWMKIQTATEKQTDRAQERMKKAVPIKKEQVADKPQPRFFYDKAGRLRDADGRLVDDGIPF